MPAGLPAKPRVTSPSAAAIGNLELAVLRRLDGLLQGDYAGLLPGPGSDTGEARPYVAGDDTRHIDWAVTARTTRAARPRHDRRPRARAVARGRRVEEPRLRHRPLREARRRLGRGGSVRSARGPRRQPRRRPHDRIDSRGVPRSVDARACRLRSSPRCVSPLRPTAPRTTPGCVKRSAEVVESRPAAGSSSCSPTSSLRLVGSASCRRSRHRHDVIAVEVVDPRELSLPDVGLLQVADAETGRRRYVDTHDRKLRERYAAAAAAQRSRDRPRRRIGRRRPPRAAHRPRLGGRSRSLRCRAA